MNSYTIKSSEIINNIKTIRGRNSFFILNLFTSFRKKYKEQAVENIESVQKTVAAGLLSDADFMSVHAPVTDYQCEQQHDNAVCGGSGQRQCGF